MEHKLSCVICDEPLSGRQRRFCSRLCKNAETNNRHQSYVAQQARGRRRKLRLIEEMGGQCARCGYRANHAALEFHHTEPDSKAFQLDLRSLSNRAWARIRDEITKCELVCANCHAEIHHPECRLNDSQSG